MREISIPEARRLGLHRQGLLKPAPFGRGKNAVARGIKHLGYVQIDTISVLDRAHHHVLPGDLDTSMPSPEEWYRFLVQRVVRGYGIDATGAFIPIGVRIATPCTGSKRFPTLRIFHLRLEYLYGENNKFRCKNSE